MTTLSIDLETRSTVDLRRAGVYKYAASPDTGIWCMAWAFDDEEVQIWTPGQELPLRIRDHLAAGGELRAWNAQFERVMWDTIMVKRLHAPPIALHQWHDTAAEAAAMALPRSLDQCAKALKLSQYAADGKTKVPLEKNMEGHNLMMRLARPRKMVDGLPIWWEDTERLDRLFEYCKQDVRVERAAAKALRRLTPHEREVYLLDQRINDRGIMIDRPLIEAARRCADRGIAEADRVLDGLTQSGVTSVKNHAALTRWVIGQGVETPGVAKAQVQELLARPDLPPHVREVLQIRADAGRSSVAKLDSLLEVATEDDRVRGLLLYHGASTGRWSGKLVQPHNFPRGEVPDVEQFIPDILTDSYEAIDVFYHPVIVVSSVLRGMLRASPGQVLVAGDYSAIEARVVNWLAGQDDVLATFREYDAGDTSKDPYKIMACRMGRAPTTALITKEDRQAGKAAELGCGFQMGAKKFVDAAWKVYQVTITKEQARQAVTAYRASHAKVKQFWYDTEAACLAAIAKPGEVQVFGGRQNLRVVVAGAYLYIVLPSGRPLCYAAPEAHAREIVIENEEGEEVRFTKVCMEYAGVDPLSRQWGRLRAYGGFLVENITQAVARDFMVVGMEAVEAAGFQVLLTVHDEIVSEIRSGFSDVATYERLLTTPPAWGAGCPITAEAWIGERYKK